MATTIFKLCPVCGGNSFIEHTYESTVQAGIRIVSQPFTGFTSDYDNAGNIETICTEKYVSLTCENCNAEFDYWNFVKP